MTIIERMFEIMQEKGIKQKELAEALGINSANVSAWNKRNTNPPMEYLPQICDRLNVTWEYLITGKDEKERGLTTEEQKMLTLYRRLDQKDRREIVGIIDLKLQQDERERKILESKIG